MRHPEAERLAALLPQLRGRCRAAAVQRHIAPLLAGGLAVDDLARMIRAAGLRSGPDGPWEQTDHVRRPIGWLRDRISRGFAVPDPAALLAAHGIPADPDRWTQADSVHGPTAPAPRPPSPSYGQQVRAAAAAGIGPCDHGEPRGPACCALCRHAGQRPAAPREVCPHGCAGELDCPACRRAAVAAYRAARGGGQPPSRAASRSLLAPVRQAAPQ